ncbi:LOW QUALITY PROTEIN: hypothetical protein OSB04_001055 [Centaurea solstitialis]|uniref:Uncharacterized protein n=1 Tax=Centaurea solstitialis TaxID=347529 RepID=A0AA38TS43_9ASTR|nr:LOW QUALITY PROTEIN: hypothetical protein OSB04_001055 [Centaurea solstitialis]
MHQKDSQLNLFSLSPSRTLPPSPIHALDGESLKDIYARFYTLISKCKRFSVARTSEENNALFLKSFGKEWTNLTMSMQSTLNLEVWSIFDIYGTLMSQEPQDEKVDWWTSGTSKLRLRRNLMKKGKEDREERREEEEKNMEEEMIKDMRE